MNILLDQTIHLSGLTTFILTLLIVVVFFGAGSVLISFFSPGERKYNPLFFVVGIFLSVIGVLSIFVVPAISYYSNLPESTPSFISKESVSINEESLDKEVEKTYGLSLIENVSVIGKAERQFNDWDKGIGLYSFRKEDGSSIICALNTEDLERNDESFSVGDAPSEIKAILICSDGSPESVKEPETVN